MYFLPDESFGHRVCSIVASCKNNTLYVGIC